jgi:hypothetical protein
LCQTLFPQTYQCESHKTAHACLIQHHWQDTNKWARKTIGLHNDPEVEGLLRRKHHELHNSMTVEGVAATGAGAADLERRVAPRRRFVVQEDDLGVGFKRYSHKYSRYARLKNIP